MKILRPILLFLLGVCFVSAHAEPRIKTVTLQGHTTLTLDIDQDGGGTRFSFPFVLDEQDDNVPFTLAMTNPAFADSYSAKKLEGRNSFVVTLPATTNNASAPQRGVLFLNVAGYEITVELHSTHDASKTFADIVFALSDSARETLIQKAIAQRSQVLERDYQNKLSGVNTLADQRALAKIGQLAMSEPVTQKIKEEGTLKTDSGEVQVYVEKSVTYGPYTILVFEIDNRSSTHTLTLQGAKVFAIDTKTHSSKPIEGGEQLPQPILPRNDGHGALTVMTAAIPTELHSLQLQLATDVGNVQVQW